ncbi:MAG: hypothetical protein ACLP8S_05380 [Solirubrobacteraceae bacterium]
MSYAYFEYSALLDDMEDIPVAALEASRLSSEERAVVMARIITFVRDRVLPQPDLEHEGLVHVHGGVTAVAGHLEVRQRTRSHDAIDELALVDPRDRVRVLRLLYRLYEVIIGHFDDAERMVASVLEGEHDYWTPSRWFG